MSPLNSTLTNKSYLDLLYASDHAVANGSSELELRIRNAIAIPEDPTNQTRYVITNASPENTQSLTKAVEIARYAKALLSKCRYLKSDDLTLEKETIRYERKTLDNVKNLRLLPIVERLKVIATSDLAQKKCPGVAVKS